MFADQSMSGQTMHCPPTAHLFVNDAQIAAHSGKEYDDPERPRTNGQVGQLSNGQP